MTIITIYNKNICVKIRLRDEKNEKYYTDYHFTASEKYSTIDTIKLVEIK